jgi:hypothetical protein
LNILGETAFAHGLALAWADERMTANEFYQLDVLQEALGLSDSERAIIESEYEGLLSEGKARLGDSPTSLAKWIDSVRALSNAHQDISSGLARRLGATALRAGITRHGWQGASVWMEQLGLIAPFAEGCWMEGGVAPPLKAIPLAFAPAAKMLDLL